MSLSQASQFVNELRPKRIHLLMRLNGTALGRGVSLSAVDEGVAGCGNPDDVFVGEVTIAGDGVAYIEVLTARMKGNGMLLDKGVLRVSLRREEGFEEARDLLALVAEFNALGGDDVDDGDLDGDDDDDVGEGECCCCCFCCCCCCAGVQSMIGPHSRKLPPREWLAGLPCFLGLLSTSASASQPEELLSTSIGEASGGLLSLL